MNEENFDKQVKENLILYRTINGLTQSEVAEMLDYSNKSISKWERGDGVPSAYVLYTLSEIYGISISELVGQSPMSKSNSALLKSIEKDNKNRLKAKKKAAERAEKQKKKDKKIKK